MKQTLDNDNPRVEEAPSRFVSSNSCRRYCISLIIAVLGVAVLWCGLVVFQADGTDIESRWIGEMYQRKTAIAESISQPKIILVGGSATLYGTSAATMTRELGVPTVNFGTHAGLGVDYLLAKARSVAKPGDTVLLSLEYQLFTRSPQSDVTVNEVLGHDRAYFDSLSIVKRSRLLFAMDSRRLVGGIKRRLRAFRVPAPHDENDLDAYGDEIHNTVVTAHSPVIRQLFAMTNNPSVELTQGVTFRPDNCRSIVRFVNWCHLHRVRVVATFPPTVAFSDYSTKTGIVAQQSYVSFYEKLGVPVVGRPSLFYYPASDFYDTVYHLNAVVEQTHTRTLDDLLRPYFLPPLVYPERH